MFLGPLPGVGVGDAVPPVMPCRPSRTRLNTGSRYEKVGPLRLLLASQAEYDIASGSPVRAGGPFAFLASGPDLSATLLILLEPTIFASRLLRGWRA